MSIRGVYLGGTREGRRKVIRRALSSKRNRNSFRGHNDPGYCDLGVGQKDCEIDDCEIDGGMVCVLLLY